MRSILFCSLLALIVAPGMAVADAGTTPPPAEPALDSAGSGSTACPAGSPDAFASAVPMLGDIGSLSTCTATAQCDGYQISCEGDSECRAVDRDCSVDEVGFVDCDGNVTTCDEPCDNGPVCGNGICEDGEEDSCFADCGSQCPPCIICPCES